MTQPQTASLVWARNSPATTKRATAYRRQRRRRSLQAWGGWLGAGLAAVWLVFVAIGS